MPPTQLHPPNDRRTLMTSALGSDVPAASPQALAAPGAAGTMTTATTGAEAGTVTVRLMTFNIQCGLQWPDVRHLILAQDVDIICLQEVPQDGHSQRDFVRVSEILDLLDWPHDLRMLWSRPPRQIGNLTLVRGRIEPGPVLKIPLTQAYGFTSRVEVGGARLTVANLHLSPLGGPPPLAFAATEILRLREVRHLNKCFGDRHSPAVAVGDFNSFWPAPACWVMRRSWKDCRNEVGGVHLATRPTYGLPFVIDHVFMRGGVRAVDYEVLPGGGSDHRAVIATLQVSKAL